MKIIQPSWEIIRPVSTEEGIASLRFIERLARISHKSEDRITEDSWDRLLRSVVLSHGDWSVVEHAVATVLFRVNRGVMFEMTRHRLFSFTAESTRFVNGRKSYPEGLEFIPPARMSDHTEAEVAYTNCENAYLQMLD